MNLGFREVLQMQQSDTALGCRATVGTARLRLAVRCHTLRRGQSQAIVRRRLQTYLRPDLLRHLQLRRHVGDQSGGPKPPTDDPEEVLT